MRIAPLVVHSLFKESTVAYEINSFHNIGDGFEQSDHKQKENNFLIPEIIIFDIIKRKVHLFQ